jgi:DNA gyrase subunit B
MAEKYTEEDVQFLDGLEPVRLRPEMYIGDRRSGGLHHLLKEVVDNAIDEYLDGHVDNIVVTINTEENIIQVRDNGRGIPVKKHPKIGISTLTGVFTRLHGGTKFGKGTYTSAVIGLHGIGVKATNALSTNLQVWTVQRKKVYTQKFERGEPVTKVKPSKQKIKRGTVVRFQPDPEIFGTTRIDSKKVRKWLRDTAYLCPGLRIKLKIDDLESVLYYSESGLDELLLRLTKDVELLHEPLVVQTKEFDLAFAWSDVEGEHWKSFVNVSATPEHGTHVVGVKKAIQNVINQYAGKKFKGDDIRDGLIGIVHARVLEPKFRGQTKIKLENTEVSEVVQKVTEDALRRFVAQNKSVAKTIVERAKQIQAAKKKFRSEQKAIKGTKVKSGARGILPGKLVECPECSSGLRELFIVEGDSALGTVVDARLKTKNGKRDIHFQEVYPIRGKLLNVARKDGLEVAMKNKEVEGLIKAVGTGVGPSFNLAKARHSGVFLLTDADPDGKHIRALLIVLFAKFLPELIEEGMLYVVRNPLFMGVSAKKRVYGDSSEEVQKKLGTSNCRITRFKGLGEMNPLDMRKSINPDTRNVTRVGWKDDDDRDLVLALMGHDSTIRKKVLGIIE